MSGDKSVNVTSRAIRDGDPFSEVSPNPDAVTSEKESEKVRISSAEASGENLPPKTSSTLIRAMS